MEQPLRRRIEKVLQFTDDEFAFFRSHFGLKHGKKGTSLINLHRPVPYIYLILTGLVKLVYCNSKGREHIISFAMEDWWESDYPAWFSRQPASLSLYCVEDTQAYSLSLDNYQKICTKLQKMEHFFLYKANRGHLASQERILSFLNDSPRERYELLLRRQPALQQRVPKVDLAAYLGVSRETLSRLWRK